MTTPFGDFGAPPDAVSWAALVLAAAICVASVGKTKILDLERCLRERPRLLLAFVAALALAACALSAGYVAYYLRGGPRIVDATSYFLQARALATGHVRFEIPSPSGSFRGRFLLASEDAHALSGIFPPGYPAVLALGFLAHAPMLVGPVIAAALVFATAALARRLFGDPRVSLLAAALSTVCAVLRYHTADTMSHGWSALLLAVTLLAASSGAGIVPAGLAGLCAGALVATRPMSGAVALALALLVAGRNLRRVLVTLLAAAPPILLLLMQQRAVTGTWFGSTQLAYYALADGPPGCFRYGFGPGIGCVFEHGDFVHAHLSHGYGVLAALGTTLRRFKMHLSDAGNAELFAPLLVCALVQTFRTKQGRLASLGILGIALVYVPFYFDGNYPGGGARFLADALPLEHALLAWSLCRFRLMRFALPLALTGFALHTSYDHRKLQTREGGRPMFEPSVLAEAGVHRGLVFVETDHGFSLGHEPGVLDASNGVVVARRRHDAHDAILWERLGRPRAYAYDFELGSDERPVTPRVSAVTLAVPNTSRLESEAEWPPLAVQGGSVLPVFPPCASGHRAVRIEPSPGPPASRVSFRIELPVPRSGRYRVTTGWVSSTHGVSATLVLTQRGGRADQRWTVESDAASGICLDLPGVPLEFGKETVFIDIFCDSTQVLDYVELSPES